MPYVCIAAIIQSERIAQNPLQCLLFSGGKAMIKDGQFYIDFPEPYKRRELNSKYREIPLKDTTSRQLRKYFNAMANLYGIIPLRKAYEIISSQSPKLVTRDEFLAFAEIARHECEDYYILGLDELYVDGKLKDVLDREIIDVSLIGDGLDRYHALLKSQQGKPYYVPSKAELLAYRHVVLEQEIPNRVHRYFQGLILGVAKHPRGDQGECHSLTSVFQGQFQR